MYMCTYVYIYMCKHIYIFMYKHTYMYIYMYVHLYITEADKGVISEMTAKAHAFYELAVAPKSVDDFFNYKQRWGQFFPF